MIKFAKQLPAICLSGLVAGALVTTAATARSMANQETLSVVKVMSVPAGRGPLSRRHLNTVPVHPNLSFKVVIRNGATPQNVTVTLRITRAPSSIGSVVKTKAIALGANRTVPVTFRNLGPIAFAQRETLKITVADRRTREQWVTIYPVIFSLA
jgi:hypothetical protein